MRLIRDYRPLLAVLLFTALTSAGCGEQPPKEIVSQAETALAEAKSGEAPLYMQDTLARAEAALNKARAAMAEKKYDEARAAAAEATALAKEAVSGTEPARAKLKSEGDLMVREVQAGIADLKSSLARGARRGSATEVRELNAAIKQMELDLINARVRLETGKIREGYDALTALRKRVSALKTESFTAPQK